MLCTGDFVLQALADECALTKLPTGSAVDQNCSQLVDCGKQSCHGNGNMQACDLPCLVATGTSVSSCV